MWFYVSMFLLELIQYHEALETIKGDSHYSSTVCPDRPFRHIGSRRRLPSFSFLLFPSLSKNTTIAFGMKTNHETCSPLEKIIGFLVIWLRRRTPIIDVDVKM